MKQVLAIVRKDLQCVRGRLATWVGVMVLKLGAALWVVWGPAADQTTLDFVGKAMIVLVATETALTFLLAAVIVQQDPLVGEQPFWRTRPISGARLLGAKALGLFLLLGLPVVLTALPWWLACGGRPGEIAWAAGQMLAVQLVIIFPAVLVASLTETLGRFLVWTLVLLMAHFAGGMVAPMMVGQSGLANMRLVLYPPLVVTTGVGVVLAQYLWRNRRASIAGLCVGWAVALAAGVWWPWEINLSSGSPGAAETPENAAIGMEIAGVSSLSRTSRANSESINTRLRVTGVPAGTYLAGYGSEHAWRWADGTSQRVRGWGVSNSGRMMAAVRHRLQLPEPAAEAERRARHAEVLGQTAGTNVSLPLAARLRSEPSRYVMSAELVLLRPQALVEVPLEGTGWTVGAGHGLRVLQIDPAGPDHTSRVTVLNSEFMSSPGGFWSSVFLRRTGNHGEVPFFWLERKEGRIKAVGPIVMGRLVIAGVMVAVEVLPLPDVDGREAPVRGVSLAWVGWERGEVFTRRATVERLEVK